MSARRQGFSTLFRTRYRILMLSFILLACTPSELSVGTDPTRDSGLLDTSGPVDTDTDVDTHDDLDFSTWTGTRNFSFRNCDGELEETGQRLSEGWDQYFVLEMFCEDCDHWYELEVGPEEACGFTVTQYTFRGLQFQDDGTVGIYDMDVGATGGGWLTSGTWASDNVITYDYYIDTIRLDGLIEFESTADDDT